MKQWICEIGEIDRVSFKASETLLGIETNAEEKASDKAYGFKASETLLGIETSFWTALVAILRVASKPLKPF